MFAWDSIHLVPLHTACMGKKTIFDFKINLEKKTYCTIIEKHREYYTLQNIVWGNLMRVVGVDMEMYMYTRGR